MSAPTRPTPATPPRGTARPGAREPLGATVRRLGSAQKSAKGAPAYSRFVNRPAGRWLAALAYRGGLTPNQVSAVSATFSFTGIVVLALVAPSWTTAAVVCLALVVGYAFDAADGQLARLRGGGSLSGEWLDHMIDAVKISALHLAVLVAVHRSFDVDERWQLVPLAFALVGAVSFFGMILNDQLRRGVALRTGTAPPQAPPSTLRSLLVLPTDYGVLCLAFALLGAPRLFLAVYAVLLAGSAGYLVLALVKWFREMRALDAQDAR